MPSTRINRRIVARLPLVALVMQPLVISAASARLPNAPYAVDLPFCPVSARYRWGVTLSFKLVVLVALLAAIAWSTVPSTSTLEGGAGQVIVGAPSGPCGKLNHCSRHQSASISVGTP